MPDQLALLDVPPGPTPRASPLPPPTRAELTQAALRSRGWTVEAIREHLGPPSRTRKSVFGGKCFLWGAARVLAAEATPAWQAWWEGHRHKREAGQRAARAAADRLAADVAAWVPKIRREPLDTLRTLAIAHYNDRLDRRRERYDDDGTPASEASDPAFLDRLCCNYVRHALTTYDAKLRALYGRTGKERAAVLVKARVFDRIAEVYPELAGEAMRQKARRCGP